MRRLVSAICGFSISMLIPVSASFAQSDSVCAIIARNLQPDVLQQGSSADQFDLIKSLIADDQYRNFSSATSSSNNFTGSVSIPGTVDAAIDDGDSSSNSNWETRRSQFLEMNYQQTSDSFRSDLLIKKISVAAIQEVVECEQEIAKSKASGIFISLDEISPERDSFAIRMVYRTGGDPNWALRELSVQPSDPNFHCAGDLHTASDLNPIRIGAMTRTINCRKSPDRHLTLVVDTTQGGGTAIPLDSTAESMKIMRDELQTQIDSSNSQIAKLNGELEKTSNSVKAFTVDVGEPKTGAVFGLAGSSAAAGSWPAGTPFWIAENDTPVRFTCPGKEVLAGMNFIMRSDGTGRHPFSVQYICKNLGP